MAPKLVQAMLNFAPQARLPERRADGAVVNAPSEAMAVAAGSVPLPPSKKSRRDLSWAHKNEVLNFKKTHTNQETLARFPEVSLSTLKRMKKQEGEIRKAVHSGRAQIKRKRPLAKYAPLGERLNEFFVLVRDAQGAVTKSLSPACPQKPNWI